MRTKRFSALSAKLFPLIIGAIFLATTCSVRSHSALQQPRILVFSKTAGFRHDSIPDGEDMANPHEPSRFAKVRPVE
jgi:hypothetical protein